MKTLLLIVSMCQLLYSEIVISNQKEILYKEFLNKREQRNIKEVDKIQYFQLIEYEKFPSLSFSFPILKNEIKDRYFKVFYKNFRAIKMEEYYSHNSKYNGISYLDEKTRVREKYYKDGSYSIINYNNDGSEETVSCKNRDSQKVCKIMWSLSQDKDVINSAHGVMIYKEYPNEMLTSEEYLKRIKEKRGKSYFNKLLEENKKKVTAKINYFKEYQIDKDGSIKFLTLTSLLTDKYIKVFYKYKKPILAQFYQDSQLIKSIKLNYQNQIKEIIDFKTKRIKEYRYGRKANSIDVIECLYLKDTCSVKEVSKITI